MPRKRYTPEQIINSLREAEVLLSQGNTTAQATYTREQDSGYWFKNGLDTNLKTGLKNGVRTLLELFSN